MGQKCKTAPAGKASRAGATSTSCDVQLCFVFSGWLGGVSNNSWILCPDRVISVVCTCEFLCRLQEEAEISGEEGFLVAISHRKPAQGGQGSQSQVPWYTKTGDQGAHGEQDACRAGVKHFGLQDVRQVRQRCLKKTPGRRIYSEIRDSLISRQADLPAGWASLLCCAKFKHRLALLGPVGLHPRGSCWASTQAMGEHWGLSSAPQKLIYTEYRDFFSTSSTVRLSYGNSKW